MQDQEMDDADFILHPQLEADSVHLGDLSLCRVLLMNDARFPWIILVPRRTDYQDMIDLTDEEAICLMWEMRVASRMMQEVARPDKLNVAALGNIVPQLHIHIIARFVSDEAWPGPVWGNSERRAYPPHMMMGLVDRMREGMMQNYNK
jgi:diadenosine tetraphosphate (Ap4A) HIT family hydrolase